MTDLEYGSKEFAIAANYEGQIQELKYQNQLLQQQVQHLQEIKSIAGQSIMYLESLVNRIIDNLFTSETKP